MQFNVGLEGAGILVAMSLGFGLIAQVIVRSTRWTWLIGAVAFFVGGLLTSEVLYGSATVEELQPNYDGLSFDEALLGGLVIGVPVVLVTWYVTRRSRRT